AVVTRGNEHVLEIEIGMLRARGGEPRKKPRDRIEDRVPLRVVAHVAKNSGKIRATLDEPRNHVGAPKEATGGVCADRKNLRCGNATQPQAECGRQLARDTSRRKKSIVQQPSDKAAAH